MTNPIHNTATDVTKPGSYEARALGCRCPVIDNAHGRGRFDDGEKYGWITTDHCPLHGTQVLK